MPKKAIFLALAVLSTACTKHKSSNAQEVTKFTPDGSLKPTVAIVPVIDNSHSELPWNVSAEFTEDVRNKILRKKKFFLADSSNIAKVTHQLKETQNPFSNDYSWVKTAFNDTQFVVFLELIEHKEELLAKDNSKGPAELHMAMRVRVFDNSKEKPRVILQEIVTEDHYIPKFFTRNTAFQPDWNEEGYSISPMGMAHAEFSAHLAKRIQHYISLHTSG